MVVTASTRSADEKPVDPDEALLREYKVGTDGASLLEFLRKRSAFDDDLQHLHRLVKQLGSGKFAEREEASAKLVTLGLVALPALRQTRQDKDEEVARRAKECVEEIEKQTRVSLPMAAVRRLLKLQPAGTIEALIRFLPYAVDEVVEEEICFGVDELTVRAGKIDPALAAALKDPLAARRALAACIVGRVGSAEQRASVRKLLNDSDALVRLRAAQGMLAGRDKDAIPALIDLLNESSIEVSWQAEELLHYVAEQDVPGETIGVGTPAERRKCQAAWAAWWRQFGPKLGTTRLGESHRRPGLLLVIDWQDQQRHTGRIWLCGCDGRPRWTLVGLHRPTDVQPLRGNQVLVAEWDTGEVTKRNLSGKVLASYWVGRHWDLSCRRMPDGNTIVASSGGSTTVRRFSPEGAEIRGNKLLINDHPVQNVRVQANGCVFCTARDDENRCWVADFDTATGNQLRGLLLKEEVSIHCRLEALPNGHALLVVTYLMWEVDAAGREVWRCTRSAIKQRAAIRLPNGNTVVVGEAGGSIDCIVEIDSAGKLLWEVPCEGKLDSVRDCLRIVRLGFGHPRPPSWDTDSVANRLAQLKSEEAIARRRAIIALGSHGAKAEPAIPSLIDAFDDPDDSVCRAVGDALVGIGPAVIPALIRALKDNRMNVRVGAATYLGYFPNKSSTIIPKLVETLKDESWRVRKASAASIGQFGSKGIDAIPALIEVMKDNNSEVAQNARYALGSIGPLAKAAVPDLVKALRTDDNAVRISILSALERIGPEAKNAVPTLIELLRAKEYKDCHTVIISALGGMSAEAKAAVPVLISSLQSTNPALRETAAQALGRIGPVAKEAVPVLIEALKAKEDSALRVEAATALGRIGPEAKDAIPALTRAKEDPDADVGWAAKIALLKVRR
jgi:HEAT repeat protein